MIGACVNGVIKYIDNIWIEVWYDQGWKFIKNI
jgi:hypothetical protein